MNNLKLLREYLGLSRQELSSATGISSFYLYQIETGKKDIGITVMKKYCELINIPKYEFWFLINYEPPNQKVISPLTKFSKGFVKFLQLNYEKETYVKANFI